MATVLIHLTSSERCTRGTSLSGVPRPIKENYIITVRHLSILRNYAKFSLK